MRNLRIGRIAIFLFFTFGFSWGFWLLITMTIGHAAYLELGLSPLDMLFPAFVALVLRLFVFGESPIHFRRYQEKPRWILYGFLLLTVVYGILTLLVLGSGVQSAVYTGVGNLLTTLWTLLVLTIAGQSSKEALERGGLQLGDISWGLKLALGVIAFFALQAGLNLILGLGGWQGQVERIYGIAVPEVLYPLGLAVAFGLAATGLPLSGLAATFGERSTAGGVSCKTNYPGWVKRVGLCWWDWSGGCGTSR
jgi:hypothetical protein